MDLQPGQSIDHFTILETLGHGGMSNVYLAHDNANDREVTLKFPHQEMMGDVSSYERFRREVKIGKLLEHPNIQKFYELGGDHFAPFMVLEYVPGCPLREYLDQQRGTNKSFDPVPAAQWLGGQIGRALVYAHSKDVFHRDLKPENVIVTPEGQAKVMDFGIAFIKGARRITWGPLSSQVGTPDYMAPEQIKGIRGDARTDIYALGMMLYECVAGRLPYEGDNAMAIMNQHVTVPAPALHRFYSKVPPALEEVIMKAIRREPNARWASMQEFIDALENPAAVDLTELRPEREADEKSARGTSMAQNELGLPAWQVALILIAIFLLMAVLTMLAQLLPHQPA